MGEVKDEGRVGVRSDNRPKHHKQPRRRGQEPGLGTGRGVYSEGVDMLVLIGVSILRLALRRLLSVVVGVSISLSTIKHPKTTLVLLRHTPTHVGGLGAEGVGSLSWQVTPKPTGERPRTAD